MSLSLHKINNSNEIPGTSLPTEILIQVLFKDHLKCHADQNITAFFYLAHVINTQ